LIGNRECWTAGKGGRVLIFDVVLGLGRCVCIMASANTLEKMRDSVDASVRTAPKISATDEEGGTPLIAG